ncbi:MAG: heme anaerobic degradation radical SAM methyltransferase ChuW/HutW [Planctomycetota bacterium]
MNWSPEALSMIEAAPPAVRPMIRQKVESIAVERGVVAISGEFVSDLMIERHGEGKTREGAHHAEQDLAPYLACEDGDPLTSAFEATNDVHVFAAGKTLTSGQAGNAWAEAERAEPTAGRPRSLYIHIPFCRSRCVFCPFYANRWSDEAGGEYARALVREIEQLAETPLGQAPLEAVYFGGGTPSDLAPEDLSAVLAAIHDNLILADDVEVTLEGRISGHSPDLTRAALDGGINRFSVGVQSFDTLLRRSLGRKANREEALAFLNRLADTPAAVVIDLIFGLPGQSMETWQEDLRRLHEETSIHGVDLYRLKSVPDSVMEEMIAVGRLPRRAGLAESAAMFAAGVETMDRFGWKRLSIPHWRRDGRERSRYNSLVKSGADCIPIGCGAGGRVGRMRFFQSGELATYLAAVQEGRKPVASAIQLGEHCDTVDRIAAGLERGHLVPTAWAEPGSPLAAALDAVLAQWARAGLLSQADDGHDLTVAGQFWSVQMGSRLAKLVQSMRRVPGVAVR